MLLLPFLSVLADCFRSINVFFVTHNSGTFQHCRVRNALSVYLKLLKSLLCINIAKCIETAFIYCILLGVISWNKDNMFGKSKYIKRKSCTAVFLTCACGICWYFFNNGAVEMNNSKCHKVKSSEFRILQLHLWIWYTKITFFYLYLTTAFSAVSKYSGIWLHPEYIWLCLCLNFANTQSVNSSKFTVYFRIT